MKTYTLEELEAVIAAFEAASNGQLQDDEVDQVADNVAKLGKLSLARQLIETMRASNELLEKLRRKRLGLRQVLHGDLPQFGTEAFGKGLMREQWLNWLNEILDEVDDPE